MIDSKNGLINIGYTGVQGSTDIYHRFLISLRASETAPMYCGLVFDLYDKNETLPAEAFKVYENYDNTNHYYPVLHSQNFHRWALPLTGGSLTGQLTVNSQLTVAKGDWNNIVLKNSSHYCVIHYGQDTATNGNFQVCLHTKAEDRTTNNRLVLYFAATDGQRPSYDMLRVTSTVDGVAQSYLLYGQHNITAQTNDPGSGSSLSSGAILLIRE